VKTESGTTDSAMLYNASATQQSAKVHKANGAIATGKYPLDHLIIYWGNMRLLFEIDTKDYSQDGTKFIRPSVRSIIIRDGKIAMIHSLKYDYYKFPGGGIENNESHIDALTRETKEEAGLIIIPESIREYGYVHRVQKGKSEDMMIQDNFYYLCDAEETMCPQTLDDYELEEKFTLEWVEPMTAIEINRKRNHGPKDKNMIEREAKVLEILMVEISSLHRK